MLNTNKNKHKKLKKKINNKERVLVIAQEIKFARLLSGNEKKSRDRVLKTLKKWLTNCFQKGYDFKEEDFARIWKGLFYAVWMSDKPLVQEELCDNIAALLDEFPQEQFKGSILMFKAGLRILGTEWYGIDQHRMDKFLMKVLKCLADLMESKSDQNGSLFYYVGVTLVDKLVRRLLRGAFRILDRCRWSQQACIEFIHTLTENEGLFSLPTPSYARNSLSLLLHITECYLEELAKVSKGNLPDDSLVVLVTPFASQIAHSKELRLAVASRKLFNYLVRQSETGQEYETRRRIWSQMGCPEGGPDALVPASDDEGSSSDADGGEEESISSALDPRAGRVNVLLPTLPVPSEKLVQLFKEYLKTTSGSAHRRVKILCQRFVELSKNEYPLQVKDDVVQPSDPELKLPKAAKAAKKLESLEKSLVEQSDELALRGLNRKQRKRLLAKTRDGVNIVEEIEKAKAQATIGAWQVEDTVTSKSKKVKTANKENVNAKKTKKRKKTEVKERTTKKQKLQQDTKEESLKNNEIANRKMKNNVVLDSKDTDKKIVNVNTSRDRGDIANDSGTDKKVKDTPGHDIGKDSGTNKKVKDTPTKEKNVQKKVETKITEAVEKPPKAENMKDKDEKKSKTVRKFYGLSKVNNTSGTDSKKPQTSKGPSLLVNKVKRFQKPLSSKNEMKSEKALTAKRVKFALKNNSMQGPVDYYRSVKNSPSIPYDGARLPAKTNLKPNSTPSPINPFFKRKLRSKS